MTTVARYMDKNREITRIKREEIRRLKEHLSLLQQRIERYQPVFKCSSRGRRTPSLPVLTPPLFRYVCYGSGPKRLPLADVLQYALEFASSKPVCTSPVEDIDPSAPPGGATGPLLLLPRSLKKIWGRLLNFIVIILNILSGQNTGRFQEMSCFSVIQTSSFQQECSPPSAAPTAQQQRAAIHKPFTQSRLPPDLPVHPAPRHITKQELQVLESCLHRWRSEVENDIHGKASRLLAPE